MTGPCLGSSSAALAGFNLASSTLLAGAAHCSAIVRLKQQQIMFGGFVPQGRAEVAGDCVGCSTIAVEPQSEFLFKTPRQR